MGATDGVKWHAHARVIKYGPEAVAEIARDLGHEPSGPELRWLEDRYGLVPDEITEADGNLLTTAGLGRITSLIIGGGGQALTAGSRAMAGVGDSTTAATVADASLGGNSSTHSWWQAMDAANPSVSGGVITGNTTYASGDGNFTAGWQEWGWGIATAAPVASAVFATATTTGLLLNHKVQALGTKVAGAVWTLNATVTFS